MKPHKFNAKYYIRYHEAYQERIDGGDNYLEVDASCDIVQVKESIQRNIDQGSTENFGDTLDDQSKGIPWIIINGVTRRYGYTK